MQFSIRPHAQRPWPDLLAVARHAAATGWDGIWFGDEAEPALECWSVVAALAAAVDGVRLGAMVDTARARHPAVVAKLAATVDHLSGGRLILGLAAGAGPDGRARLEEECQVVTNLVSADRTTLRGEFYQLNEAPLDPKPLQRPLPLLIEDDAQVAARYATHWSVCGTPEAVAGRIRAVRSLCQDIGRDPAELSILVRAAPGTLESGTAELRDLLGRYRDAGIDGWVLPEQRLDVLDRFITEVAPGFR